MIDKDLQLKQNLKVGLMLVGIVEALIDDEVDCPFRTDNEGDLTTFKIEIPRSQMGKVIGKEGKMARAIRTILQAAAHQAGRRFSLDLEEAE